MSGNNSMDLYLRPLPYLDEKWLRADLINSLRSIEDASLLWNNLIQDCELVSSPASPILNSVGQWAYLGDDGKHYCGAQRLSCTCCPEEYCGPLTACNCSSCRTLDSDAAIRKMTSAAQTAANQRIYSDVIFESWLWGQCPSYQAKKDCQRILLNELHDIALQAASNCLSASHLKHQLFIYERFFVALSRTKQLKLQNPPLEPIPQISLNSEKRGDQILYIRNRSTNPFVVPPNHPNNNKRLQNNIIDVPSPIKEPDRATLGLARVGTRAALNFSFAFLRRAWRSGEDTELCSELLSEALESLQDLPEASLFDAQGVSPLWIEVLERSIKFLRQVALGDQLGGRCLAPREDRHTALCLLLELGAQKGTLAATLEAIVLLLTLWDKEKETEDNREPQNIGAPLVPILRRYESIGNYGFTNPLEDTSSSATESFLRFLTLPEQDTANVDLKQAAVVIISHIDRLAKPLIPKNIILPTTSSLATPSNSCTNFTNKTRQTSSSVSFCTKLTTSSEQDVQEETSDVSIVQQQEEQRIYALGWIQLNNDIPGFTAEPAIRLTNDPSNSNYNAAILNFDFQIKQVAFSEDIVVFLTLKGKMLTWRISKPESEPIVIESMEKTIITSIAAHFDGKHFLAVDNKGDGYSWGCGEGGRLGHGDVLPRDEPTQIICIERSFRSVYCGCSYSAAITSSGALYTWGKGNFGRLGHGTSDDKLLPTYVSALRDHHIVDAALGSGDAHTLCVTAEGLLFAWGDGEFGKLGNGSFNGSSLPIQIETVPKIQRVFSGSQFSIALSQDGKLFTWGKPCAGRLGHEHFDRNLPGISVPKLVTSLQSKQIVDVSVGLFHCLALSSNGEVFGWGRNDTQQICPTSINRDSYIKTPILACHPSVHAFGIACGPMQSIIWSRTSIQGIPNREPFVIDLTEHTFRLLDQLIGLVCGQDTNPNNRQTPSQESECIAVACLNLLRLQLHSLIANNIAPKSVGLVENSRLLVNMKTRILNLAGGANVLRTIQKAAQKCLEIGWSILLPTPSERAQTLTSLLPSEPGITSPGHRFMTDLLVGSLMAEGGLETALNQAIHSENTETSEYSTKLPLLHLITQLLRNNSYLTQAHLTQLLINPSGLLKNEEDSPILSNNYHQTSPSLDLLHRFQRLLFSYIHQAKTEDISGAETLLTKYIQSVVSLCILSLQKAHEIAIKGKDGVPLVLNNDISDTLLFELIIGLILIKRDRCNILNSLDWMKIFVPLLHALDSFNRSIGFTDVQDFDDLSWPGIISRSHQKIFSHHMDDFNVIRKSEFENELMENGKLIIIKGHVCDIHDYKCGIAIIDDFLEKNIGKDITHEFRNPIYRKALEFIFNNFNIGQYGPALAEDKSHLNINRLLTHFSSERALGYLLGLVANLDQIGPPLQPAELHCKNITKSSILCGGLQVLQPSNPFDEEKLEARSSASTAGNTPTEAPLNALPKAMYNQPVHSSPNIEQRIDIFINILAEAKTTEPLVVTWMTLSERYCKENNLMCHQDFPSEHPIQELERLLTAVLIRHQSLGGLVLNALEHELNGTSMTSSDTTPLDSTDRFSKIPKEIADIIRMVYQTKWAVIRNRQQLNRSYKEVCAPMLERLRFLLYEVRPAISLEQYGFKKLTILHKLPRFRQLVKNIIVDMRAAKKQLVCAKPEDILNVTIQSQNAAQRLNQSQESLLMHQQTSQQQQQLQQQHLQQQQVVDMEIDEKSSINDSGICSATTLVVNSQQDLLESTENNLNLSSERKCSHEDIKIETTTDLCLEDKKQDDSKPQLNNEFLKKLSEKWYFLGELNKTIMHDIVEFLMQEDCDVETVRRAMFCQVQRYHIRKKGLDLFYKLIKQQGLLDAVQYNMISGYLGLNHKNNKQSVQHILTDLNWLTALQKANLVLSQSKTLEWSVCELQRLVNKEQPPIMKSKQSSGAYGKDTSNLGTYSFLKKLPRARFLLSIFGILSKDMRGNEISLLINSGVLGVVLALLSQTGGDTPAVRNSNELSVVYEDTILNQKSNKANLSGPELAKLMKIGTRIVRGADWKWGDQDGNPPGEGRIISEVGEDGWVRVEWFATGATNSYRMGKEGQYDLRLADSALNVISPDSETEKDDFSTETSINGETHPTKLLRYACAKFLQIIAVGIGMHSEEMDKFSVRTIASMFRSILDTKSTLANICGLDNWTTLGFLRSICGESRVLSKHLTSPSWLDFYINLLELPSLKEQDVFRKVNCLRLLQTVLIHWMDDGDLDGMSNLVQQLFSALGKITLYCPNDISLQQNYQDTNKPRILLSASHSGTVAEEIITLLRKLHTLPNWNGIINSFLSQKLCVAADIYGESNFDLEHLENEYRYVMGVLNTIGGCDLRPRIGLQVCHEGSLATVCGFTTKGKCLLSTEGQHSELRKVPLGTIMECADYSVFSLSRLPMNEMLLNSWSILLFGPGDRKECIPNSIDISLLRSQQIQLSVLNANCVLYRHQNNLRNILKQRSPIIHCYTPDESLSEDENQIKDPNAMMTPLTNEHDEQNNLSSESPNIRSTTIDHELLVQSILIRATQPSQLKASYSFQDLSIAALNCTHLLASQIHNEFQDNQATTLNTNGHNGNIVNGDNCYLRNHLLNRQATMIHGVPLYNMSVTTNNMNYRNLDPEIMKSSSLEANSSLCLLQNSSASSLGSGTGAGSGSGSGSVLGLTSIGANTIQTLASSVANHSLITQIKEMGFSKTSIDIALQKLGCINKLNPTPEQIVQWIVEHPECFLNDRYHPLEETPAVPSASASAAGDGFTKELNSLGRDHLDLDDTSSSDTDSTSDTIEGSSLQETIQRFETRSDFHTADQYAIYVRGLICPGALVKCYNDFEEIKKGDIGTVLKVDTEGLHNLNVQVDWQVYGNTYWVCFVHLELIELPTSSSSAATNPNTTKSKTTSSNLAIQNPIVIGSQVKLKTSARYKWNHGGSSNGHVHGHAHIGTVVSTNGKEVFVDFPQQSGWKGSINDLELLNPSSKTNTTLLGLSNHSNNTISHLQSNDLIEDWSRCIRSLTVSSNKDTAKHLLEYTSDCWQSASNGQDKHWIRLEMHENILIHKLTMTVSPDDHSHMPSLVVTRVGDSLDNLIEYSWISIKQTDHIVTLMTNVRQYYPWIEIVIKQCRNNGIQCKVHRIDLIGRKKQNDLDLMLLNASFLANDYDDNYAECQQQISSSTNSYSDCKTSVSDIPCTVMVWGLNDKEQLGGLKGSKVKVPTFSQTISRLRPIHIVGGSKSLFIVSQDGKVYACGEGTNGRLGLGITTNVSLPRLIQVLHQYVVKKVAVHSGGKHALALTLDGKVFSWGEGEDGKLGHGNRLTFDKPKMIEAFRSKKIRDIACGSSHSAAITSSGDLYTWGLGEYGRLGHADHSTQLKPKLVTSLLGKRVIQVACGSRDAQTLALTEDGTVYSWGDGDFGKLGRGGSEGSSIPHEIERLSGLGVIQIECGAQFSLALTRSGEVWTWGKGDYYRLGHGNDQHVRKPQPVQGLKGRKVIHVAVGALHCLAVTDSGQVYAWGDNDHGQQGSGNTIVNKRPSLVIGLDSVFVNRVACGSSHSIAWGMPQTPTEEEKKGPVPFSSNKDPLGGNSLGIYDAEESEKPTNGNDPIKSSSSSSLRKPSLSDILLSLDTNGARQTALNYVLNSMSILQARQLIISALTSHCKVNLNDRISNDIDTEYGSFKDPQNLNNSINNNNNLMVKSSLHQNSNEIIAQGGGEAPADPTDPAVHEPTPETEIIPAPAGPLSAFHSLTGSISLSGSISSNAPHKHSKMSASAMSVMAATMTNQEEIIEETSLTGLDDFTSLFGESEAKSLIELLKLSVAGRTGPPSTSQTIADTLIALGSNSPSIGSMLLETCIVELEDLCTSRHSLGKLPKPVMQESSHPYGDNVCINGHVKIPSAEALRLEFDTQCSTEKRNDPLVVMDGTGRVVAIRSGREFAQWATEIRIPGDEMRWKFTSDSSVNGWGFRFWVHAIMPSSILIDRGSDRAVLSQPSIALVMALLNERIMPHNSAVLLRLAAALSACAQLNSLTTQQRIWALKHLHTVLANKHSPKPSNPSLTPILMPLIPELLRQYEYEEPQVRGGLHLMHSEYFKTLAALAADMDLDSVLPSTDTQKWSWFKRYCVAIRVAKSLIHRYELPKSFCLEVRKKLSEMMPSQLSGGNVRNQSSSSSMHSPNSSSMNTSLIMSSQMCPNSAPPTTAPSSANLINYMETGLSGSLQENLAAAASVSATSSFNDLLTHEDHNLFKVEHDSQLLQWLNRRPDDWSLAWGGASTIYGWGHNHRGQLGGLEGSRIKTPTPCEALSLLRPVQLAGGEQTLFAVTPDGKLFATGYGAGGRLGVGGTDSWAVPTLISSLQHVFVKKVAVNSGGKHCLALTTEGEVYSWGEGEDGKLGHGSRMSYDRPKLIEDLTGIGIVDIACGSAHSAAITSSGHVLTWGKGRYGRLGHGDSEDQLRPKLVEALLGYKAIDIACGSGDAQTLCITDDDSVWSWGDGDYGKLGRGGSDGCKIPYKIESLTGLGVIKVECGSQFSVALTRSGAVYTWGKGDFHRLGHGSVDHVRRPKKVAALQGKKVVSIATGSLHCVACTDNGEVFTWGDNDEGQLGDGTVSAIQRPRLVQALQGKHIVKVTCGSAHTLALSTSQLSERARPPPNPPLEYDLVRDLPPEALHSRLVLLHHFSELLCPCLTMLHITGTISLSALKDVLVYSIKEAAFRKVIQTTMVRDKQHGPVIELNRIQVKRSRNKSGNGLAGIDGMKSVFGQMVQKLPLLTQESLSLPHRVWKVKFVGESVDDCGGGYSESIAEMCDELQNGSVPLLINTPNGRGEAGANRDCFLLDPTLTSVLQMNMFRFLGVLMGVAVRTGSPLSLNLAEPVWRQLAGEELRPSDLTEVDRDYVTGLLCIRNMDNDPKSFTHLELPFSTYSAKGHEVPLSTRYNRVTAQNRHEYVRLALNFRLHEFDEQVKAVRDGMSKVIPVPLLSLFSAAELQAMVCGSPDIPLGLLKSVATYKGFDATSALVQWFWEVMEEFSNQERSLFLRFVWGRTRLPRTIADFRGRDFVLQVLEKSPPDHFLPESYTCFFLLKMPRYSCKAVLLEKLKYAIHFCKSIDTDEYARVAMGDPTEATGSEDNSDIESVTSHDV